VKFPADAAKDALDVFALALGLEVAQRHDRQRGGREEEAGFRRTGRLEEGRWELVRRQGGGAEDDQALAQFRSSRTLAGPGIAFDSRDDPRRGTREPSPAPSTHSLISLLLTAPVEVVPVFPAKLLRYNGDAKTRAERSSMRPPSLFPKSHGSSRSKVQRLSRMSRDTFSGVAGVDQAG
jgi:hypothetical protein